MTKCANKLGWIDMVLHWNATNQMDKDAVRIALLNAADERKELLEALKALIRNCADYEAWQRPCLAFDQAKEVVFSMEGQ